MRKALRVAKDFESALFAANGKTMGSPLRARTRQTMDERIDNLKSCRTLSVLSMPFSMSYLSAGCKSSCIQANLASSLFMPWHVEDVRQHR